MGSFVNCFTKRLSLFLKRSVYVLSNLSVHGVSFLVRKDVHFIYKFLYAVIFIFLWYEMIVLLMKSNNSYSENSIRFTTETTYISWNTTFPAVTVCETSNIDKVIARRQRVYGSDKSGTLDIYLNEVVYFSGTCYSCEGTCSRIRCPTEFKKMQTLFRSPCHELLVECQWRGKDFDCCTYFLPTETEYGICFSINSKHAIKQNNLNNDVPFLMSNRELGPGYLKVVGAFDYELFIHSPEDVPFFNIENDKKYVVRYGSTLDVLFTVTDIVNENQVIATTPNVRQCRFDDEVTDSYLAYGIYSYSICIVQCRIEAQIEICNCTHHMMPGVYEEWYCDMDGLKCLTRFYEVLNTLWAPNYDVDGIQCNCLPSCTEPDYNIVRSTLSEPMLEIKGSTASLRMASLPSQRYTRQVTRVTLDLVVSIGNAVGLFFGASILTFVELIYFLFLKRWKYVDTKKHIK